MARRHVLALLLAVGAGACDRLELSDEGQYWLVSSLVQRTPDISARVLVGSDLQFDPCPLIREGMMVEVVHGPLRGVIGRLMRKDSAKARLVLSVDLIGQAVSVEVDAADVKAY